MILAESYTQLATDPAHILFELTWEIITAVLVYMVAKPLVRRAKDHFHTELDKAHGVEHLQDGTAVDIDELHTQYVHAVAALKQTTAALEKTRDVANHNFQAWEHQKKAADAAADMLARELGKDL